MPLNKLYLMSNTVSSSNSIKPKSKRIFYFDALRALAIISVILVHIFAETMNLNFFNYPIITTNWLISDILGNCFRFGVDLFLMLSGALSLGRVWDIKSFLGKRIPRIVLPFLFWGVGLSILLIILTYTFPSFVPEITKFDIISCLKYIYECLMGYNRGFTQYWFFWMILGTYLIMPILNKWLYNSDLKEAEYFIVIWLITCIFQYTLKISFPITLTYFTGPIGMVVLGYYLRHTNRKLLNNPYFAILITIISAITMIILSYHLSSPNKFYFFNRYSIFLAIEVSGIFLLFKNFNKLNIQLNNLKKSKDLFKKTAFSIAKYSYGIYLIHRLVIVIISKIFSNVLSYPSLVLVLFIGTLGVSWFVLSILNKIPVVNQLIGAK